MPIDPGQVPTGTVTFVFTDVVGSTRSVGCGHGGDVGVAAYPRSDLERHNLENSPGLCTRRPVTPSRPAFRHASAAVEGATAIRRTPLGAIDWGSWPAISVRIGLHLGEAEERDGNYYGPSVNQAARVMAVAHGGQCVLTDAVRDAAGITATDLGVHKFRDIETPVHLSQLGDQQFPPLWSVGTGIVSLPSPRTSFVGREDLVVTTCLASRGGAARDPDGCRWVRQDPAP